MGANVSDKKYFPLFRVLMEKVFEKAGFKDQFSLINADHRLAKIASNLKKISSKDYPKKGTIRDYVSRYRGESKFTIQKIKLNILCKYINENSWNAFKSKYFFEASESINSMNTYSKQQFKNIRKKIAFYYKDHSHFNTIALIGDVDQNFPSLDIGEFYTDLSYVKKESIKNSNSLLNKEKSTYSTTLRKEKLNVSEKLAETIISNHKRTVILGNPGTGKSIFSRHLCYKWARGKMISDDLFIHIVLKKLDFTKKNQCIPLYIKNTYLHDMSDTSFNTWPFFENTFFILDGFDEISNTNKSILLDSLFQWVKDPKYVILSRPYGILNQQISYNGFLEILGFNEATRLKYIKTLLETTEQKYTLDSILSELDSNPQLYDLSFNPLMLSYLVLIIVNEGVIGLRNIHSIYDLQSKISGWLERYYQTKIYTSLDYQSNIIEGKILAYEMELKQEYVCYRSSKTIKYDLTTNILDKTGIGRKEPFDNDASWCFYFSSATFQEFLAAKAILAVVEPDHIFQLLRNQLYWNFTRMIIGGLNNISEVRVHEVLDYLIEKFEEDNNESIFLLHIILLAETSTKIIHKRVDSITFTKIINGLYKRFDAEGWSKLIVDATIKIYQKLSFRQTGLFLNIFIEKTIKNYSKSPENSRFIFSDFSTRLQFYKDARFIKEILLRIDNFISEYNELYKKKEDAEDSSQEQNNNTYFPNQENVNSFLDSEEDKQKDFLNNIIDLLLKLIEKAPIELLAPYKESFQLIEKITLNFMDITSYILDRLMSPENLEKDASNYFNTIHEKLKSQDNEESELSFNDYSPYHIGIKCVSLAKTFKDADLHKRNQISDLIFKGLNAATEIAIITGYELEIVLDKFIFAINHLKANNFLTDLIELIDKNNVVERIVVEDMTMLNTIVSSHLQHYIKDISNWEQFKVTFNIMAYTEHSHYLFSNYIDDFIKILDSLLYTYGNELDEKYTLSLNEDKEDFDTHEAKVAITKIICGSNYAYERYSLFLYLTKSTHVNYKFVQHFLIPTLITQGLSTTNNTIWKYIHQISEVSTPNEILRLLDREEIYEYRSNFNEVTKIMTHLREILKSYEFENQNSPYKSAHYILYRVGFFISKTLITASINFEKEKKELIPILLDILLNPNFIAMRYGDSHGYLDLVHFKLFPLNLYELTGDNTIITKLSLASMYTEEEDISVDYHFCQYAIEIFGLQKLKNEYAEILGKENIKAITKHYHEHIELFQPVDTVELLALVSSK